MAKKPKGQFWPHEPIEYLSTAHLARELEISQIHVQKLIKWGKIEPPEAVQISVGKHPPRYLYTREQLNRIVKMRAGRY